MTGTAFAALGAGGGCGVGGGSGGEPCGGSIDFTGGSGTGGTSNPQGGFAFGEGTGYGSGPELLNHCGFGGGNVVSGGFQQHTSC